MGLQNLIGLLSNMANKKSKETVTISKEEFEKLSKISEYFGHNYDEIKSQEERRLKQLSPDKKLFKATFETVIYADWQTTVNIIEKLTTPTMCRLTPLNYDNIDEIKGFEDIPDSWDSYGCPIINTKGEQSEKGIDEILELDLD